jgi:hypothetical protein
MNDLLFEQRATPKTVRVKETDDSWLRGWQKLLLSLSMLGTILWLGGYIVRTSIAYDLFIPGTLTFKTSFPADAVAQTLRLYSRMAFYTLYGYGFALLGFVPVFFSLKKHWRSYGWLFMSGWLFLLYVPVESAIIYYDVQLFNIIPNTDTLVAFDVEAAKKILLESLQIKIFGGFGQLARSLAFFSYITAILVVVWRPLHKKMYDTPAR